MPKLATMLAQKKPRSVLVEFVPQERTGDERAPASRREGWQGAGWCWGCAAALFGGAFVVAVERHGQYADDGTADGKRDGDEGQAEEVENVEEGVEVSFEFFRLAVFGDVVDAFFHDGLFVFAQEDAACLPAAFLSGNGKDGNGGVGGGAAVVVGEGADVEEQVFVPGMSWMKP